MSVTGEEIVYVVVAKDGEVVGVRRSELSADKLRQRWDHDYPEKAPCVVEDHPIWD